MFKISTVLKMLFNILINECIVEKITSFSREFQQDK